MADVVAINYSRDAGWSGAVMAELCRDGDSTAVVTFNYDGGAEIGVYRHSLPGTTFSQIAGEVRRSGYDRLPVPASVPPETKFITVGERLEGQPLPTLRQFDLRLVPPAIGALGQQVEKVIDDIRQHRSRVIQAGAAWLRSPIDASEPLGLRITLHNAGALPLALGNPLGAARGSWCGLRLFLYDVAAATESSVDLELVHLRSAPGTPVDPIVTLAPRGTLTVDVKKRVYLVPGHYTARISYQNVADDPDDPQLVRGELMLDLGALQVARP